MEAIRGQLPSPSTEILFGDHYCSNLDINSNDKRTDSSTMFPHAELLDVPVSESLLSEMKSKEENLDTKLCNRDHKSSPDLSEPTESPGQLNDSDLPSSTTCTPEDSEDDLPDKPIKIKPWSLLE